MSLQLYLLLSGPEAAAGLAVGGLAPPAWLYHLGLECLHSASVRPVGKNLPYGPASLDSLIQKSNAVASAGAGNLEHMLENLLGSGGHL